MRVLEKEVVDGGKIDLLLNKIIEGDCLEVLRKIPCESVDIIITSPPYNIGNMKSNHIKYGTYAGNNMPETLYQSWQKEVLKECFRILKEDGSLFYNHKVRIKNGRAIHPLEWLLKTDFTLKQEITWDMGKSANCDKIRFFPFSERIYWMTKAPKTKLNNALNLSDVWRVVPTHRRKDTGHIAVMPEEIVDNILESVEGEIVLDPFAGSGTTLVSALKYDRYFIGMEIDRTYCDLIESRINDTVEELIKDEMIDKGESIN